MATQTPQPPHTPEAAPAAEKIAPQSTVGSKTSDRTKRGDTSRGFDEGAIEIGATGKRGQFGG
jgi:hypothetical protein